MPWISAWAVTLLAEHSSVCGRGGGNQRKAANRGTGISAADRQEPGVEFSSRPRRNLQRTFICSRLGSRLRLAVSGDDWVFLGMSQLSCFSSLILVRDDLYDVH